MKTQLWQMWDELAKPRNARIAEFLRFRERFFVQVHTQKSTEEPIHTQKSPTLPPKSPILPTQKSHIAAKEPCIMHPNFLYCSSVFGAGTYARVFHIAAK